MELIAVESAAPIPPQYRGTPIADLLEYHNLERPFDTYTTARLLVGMCMDSRKHLKIPENFSFIIRSGGANVRYSEVKVSYAIACSGVRAIAVMGPTKAGMVNLAAKRDLFLGGLVEHAGWAREHAEEHFNSL